MNCNDIKLLSRKELLELLPMKKFKTKPFHHQLAALVGCIIYDGFIVNLDIGTGKSKVGIDATTYFFGKKANVVVVCSIKSAMYKWAEEVEKHSDSKAVVIDGTAAEKIELYNSNSNCYKTMIYETLPILFGKKEAVISKGKIIKTKTGRIKTRNQVDHGKIRKAKIDVLIIDESQNCKNPDTLNYRICKQLTKKAERLCELTGTIFGNTELDIWAQYYLADDGKSFGKTFRGFKLENFENKGYFGPKWVITKEGRERIQKRLYNRAIRIDESECSDLPEKVYDIIKYKLTPEQKAAYAQAEAGLVITKASQFEIANKTMVFRQICSGFIYKKTKTGRKTIVIKGENPKLNDMMDKIEESIETTKVVVFYEFNCEQTLIKQELEKRKIKFAMIGKGIKQPQLEMKRFQNDPKTKVIVIHPKSGGDSIDLIEGTVTCYFSTGDSLIERLQSEKRTNRTGQTKKCRYYDFAGIGTVEVSRLKNLRDRKEAFAGLTNAGNKKIANFIRGKI
jgi:SNF2 family DNA or RNA helicase